MNNLNHDIKLLKAVICFNLNKHTHTHTHTFLGSIYTIHSILAVHSESSLLWEGKFNSPSTFCFKKLDWLGVGMRGHNSSPKLWASGAAGDHSSIPLQSLGGVYLTLFILPQNSLVQYLAPSRHSFVKQILSIRLFSIRGQSTHHHVTLPLPVLFSFDLSSYKNRRKNGAIAS